MTTALPNLLEFAIDTVRRAGAVTLDYFQSTRLQVDAKADGTPVTEADRRAEQLIRERIADKFPEHAIMGEEFGERPGHPLPGSRPPRYRWIIDPIDGTKSFVHGVPLYGVMMGLEIDQSPALGVINFPATKELIAAARGLGCRYNDRLCQVRPCPDLAQATVLASGLHAFHATGLAAGFDRLLARTRIFRTWGDCYGYMLVATGRADIMIDPIAELWDASPLLPIITEADGRFTDLSGKETIYGHSALATNGEIHDQVLAILKQPN